MQTALGTLGVCDRAACKPTPTATTTGTAEVVSQIPLGDDVLPALSGLACNACDKPTTTAAATIKSRLTMPRAACTTANSIRAITASGANHCTRTWGSPSVTADTATASTGIC